MNIPLVDFLQIDLPALLAGALACVACALWGNFLVLRRQSLMGDAIAHVVLPGIVVGFLLSQSRTTGVVFVGAIVAAGISAGLIELIRRLGRVEPGAAMGVVFSIMFALGVVLMERAAAGNVDLDADCVLYGQLEGIQWWALAGWSSLFDPAAWASFPREVTTLTAVTALSATLIVVFFKELRITSFDAALATTLGFHAGAFHMGLMLLVAVCAVAAFEAVGSILVIAMFICPPATMRMLTDRLSTQVWGSAVVAAVAAVGGYLAAAFGPALLHAWGVIGWSGSLNAAGMIALASGVLMGAAIIAAPRHGVVARRLRTLRLSVQVAREDLLGMLYRVEEGGRDAVPRTLALRALAATGAGPAAARMALRSARSAAETAHAQHGLSLTPHGRDRARSLVRAHRLWESFLVSELGLRPDHVHKTAMALEHVTDEGMQESLAQRGGGATDPHGKPIPGEVE